MKPTKPPVPDIWKNEEGQSVQDVLVSLRDKPPRTRADIMRGFSVRLKRAGIPIARLHYSAHPDRDPEINPRWEIEERGKYSSQAAFDKEQNIMDLAGGGDRVFADILIAHANKIIISKKGWRPDPGWRCYGGFDEGETNPTAMVKCYVDYDGNKYLCGEYYMRGKKIWQHAPEIKRMEGIDRMRDCYADPNIFVKRHQQNQRGPGKPNKEISVSTNDLYMDEGVELFTAYAGDRSDISMVERIHSHWKNLDKADVMPSLYIVCDFADWDAPRPGLWSWSCPNLLWEMMRLRKKKLSALQLTQRNPTEEIIQKDNHMIDTVKYVLGSLPAPAVKTPEQLLKERMEKIPIEDVTSRVIRGQEAMADIQTQVQAQSIPMGRGRPRRR